MSVSYLVTVVGLPVGADPDWEQAERAIEIADAERLRICGRYDTEIDELFAESEAAAVVLARVRLQTALGFFRQQFEKLSAGRSEGWFSGEIVCHGMRTFVALAVEESPLHEAAQLLAAAKVMQAAGFDGADTRFGEPGLYVSF